MLFPLLPRLAATAPSSLLLTLRTSLSTSPRTLLALTATTSTLGIGMYTLHTRPSPFTSAFQNFTSPLETLSRHLRSRKHLLSCDASSPLASSSGNWSYSAYEHDAKAPITKGGTVNTEIYRQLSWGSVAGLLGGVAVSVFSRPLALLIGLLVFGLQFLEYNGLHIIPYRSMQRYVTSVNLRSAIMDNVAFKLSFGATFALAAFAEF